MWWHFNAQVKGLEHILRHWGGRNFFPAVPKTCNLSNFNMWKISLKTLDLFLCVVSVCNISMKYFFPHFNVLEICSCMNSRSLDTTLYAWPKVGSDRQNENEPFTYLRRQKNWKIVQKKIMFVRVCLKY